jgi:ubiquitin-conjugating enzyme E2 variant
LHWTVVLFALLVAQANQVHKWAHANVREKPWAVRMLQRARVLQTPRHHAGHHLGTRDTHFCVLTNVLNPVLETLRLWRGLEAVVTRLTGAQPRDDAAALARLGLAAPRG